MKHEKIDKLLFTPPPPPHPYPTGGGGGLGVNIGGTDGREGLMGGRDVMAIMKLTQCIWHGMGA